MPSVERVFIRHGSFHYDLGRDEQGKRRSMVLCRVTDGEHAVYSALARIVKPGARSVREMYESFLSHGTTELAPRTRLDYFTYRDALYDVFGDTDPDDIEPMHIAQYLEGRSAKKLANKEIAALSSSYNYAMRRGLVSRNPCKGVRRNRVKPRDRYVRHDEFLGVFNAVPEHVQDLMSGIYLMVIRPGEARRLRRTCITPDGVLIEETKTGKRKLVQWSPALQFFLTRATSRAPDSPFVFTNSRGEPWTEFAMHSALKRLWPNVTVARWRWHDLRAKGESDHKDGGHGLLALYKRAKIVSPVA